MNPTQSRILAIAILFPVIFVTGYWLSRMQKPYGTIPLNIHKLIALADLVLLLITVYWIHRSAPLMPQTRAAVIIAVLLFAATIVTGGLVSILGNGGLESIGPSARTAISLAHNILPYLSALSTALALYLALIPRAA